MHVKIFYFKCTKCAQEVMLLYVYTTGKAIDYNIPSSFFAYQSIGSAPLLSLLLLKMWRRKEEEKTCIGIKSTPVAASGSTEATQFAAVARGGIFLPHIITVSVQIRSDAGVFLSREKNKSGQFNCFKKTSVVADGAKSYSNKKKSSSLGGTKFENGTGKGRC